MKVIRTIAASRRFLARAPRPVAFVPTMGALHEGHASLIDRARKLVGKKGTVVVSIFVNPTQFGPKEDFSRYPRPFAEDSAICKARGVDLIFHPSAEEMYPADRSVFIDESSLSSTLCGASRPGHFRGVCTVVAKLFQIVQPEFAVFGLKDFQQCMVIRRMVRDLNFPVKIVPSETVREPDGLAMSSRNRYLTPEERAQAPVLRRALLRAREAFRVGEKSAAKLQRILLKTIAEAPLARVDYAAVVDAETLQPVKTVARGSAFLVAVFFGKTRLIDNLWLR